MTSKTFKLVSTALVSVLALASQSAFSSTTLTYQGASFPSYETVHTSYADGAGVGYPDFGDKYVYVGGFKMGVGNTNQSITAWCVDVFDWLHSASYSNGNLSSINHNDKLQQLVNQRYASVTNAQTSAAFQLAVWEIVTEAGNTFNLGNGQFKAWGGNTTAIAMANDWLKLDKTTGNRNYKIDYYFYGNMPNGVTQNLISVSPVPLPAAGLLMLSALGLGGLVKRRRASVKK
jgi:hypothetical protein